MAKTTKESAKVSVKESAKETKATKDTKDTKEKAASNGSAPSKATKTAAKVAVVKAKEVFKAPFAADELSKWKQILLSRRAEITDDIAGLVKDAMEAEDGHTTPNHIAERGSDADLQDLSLGVAGEEKDVVWQIDRALRKIDVNHPMPYGLCEYTKEPIPRTRLQLIPWTPLSIEGATHLEKNNLTVEDLLADE
jgi:RNA polymerase-binding transcription factor DksA